MRCLEKELYRKIYYRELAEGVRHYKETEGGRIEMCDLVKEYAE